MKRLAKESLNIIIHSFRRYRSGIRTFVAFRLPGFLRVFQQRLYLAWRFVWQRIAQATKALLHASFNACRSIGHFLLLLLLPRSTDDEDRVDYHRLCKDLITSLFYPAVLGTIIFNLAFSLLEQNKPTPVNIPAIVLSIAIIVHYVVDFMYTLYFESYSALAFVADLLVIILMLLASYSVDISSGAIHLEAVSWYFVLTYITFLIIDIYTIWTYKRLTRTVLTEAVILIAFFIQYSKGYFGPLGLAGLIFASSLLLYLISPKPRFAALAQTTSFNVRHIK